ncbi:MAG: RHS repeat-associated core domain-containing protein, partial [Waterburya sp.]
ANPGWTRNYAYNETSLLEPSKQSNRLSNTRLTGNNPIVSSYIHDAHGNMIRMPHLANHADATTPNMHWDYKDQLQQADLGGGGTAYYVYDAAGQRTRKVIEKAPGLTEERIYLGGFEVFRKRNGTGTITLERETLHIMDSQQRIALVETRTIDSNNTDPAPAQLIRYQLGNHLGSASVELDDQAQIISYEEYTPYGSSSYQAVRSQTETSKRYRYTGKERDEESELYYHGARYYAPWLARWLNPDPSATKDGLNIYKYVADNPVTFVDPNGRAKTPTVGQIIDEKGIKAASEGRTLDAYSWAFAQAAWNIFGAEGVSAVAAKGSDASLKDYGQAGIEILTSGGGSAGKAVFKAVVTTVVAKEVGERVAREAVEETAEVLIKETVEETAETATTVVAKETAETATKEIAEETAEIKIPASWRDEVASRLKKSKPSQNSDLKLLHGEASLSKSSLDYWAKQSTEKIVESLKLVSKEPLRLKGNKIMQGNHRIKILMERGYDVKSLPFLPHK